MIYIDPPYNTGKDFVYKDNFKDNLKNYLEITGQLGEDGQRLSTNSETSGRYHSDWLNMMYPRLKLARNLLTDDGVIFISIDDNEQENLKKLCDEIFGEEKVEIYVWDLQDKTEGSFTKTASNTVRKTHEYILACFKNEKKLGRYLEYRFKDRNDFTNPDNDIRGNWMSGNMSRNGIKTTTGSKYYEIITPTGVSYKRNWTLSKEEYEEYLKDNRIYFADNGNGVPRIKIFQNEPQYSIQNSIFKDLKSSSSGRASVVELFNQEVFDFPKSVQLLERIAEICTERENDIILDFFSGSATTAHAVMQLNVKDKGNRKYIMVQLPEACDEKSEAYKAGYKNICEIGKERIRRAGAKIKADESLPLENREKLDIGFKVFKLDSSNIKEWDSETDDLKQTLLDSIDNIKSDRNSLDVLYEIILKYGLELTVPIEENEHFYSIGGGTLLINLDKKIDMEVIDSICEEYRNLLEIDEDFKTTVVLRDSAFKNDVDKTNAMKKLEQVGIKEVRSI